MLTSLQHPIVKHFVKLRENRRYRTSEGRLVVSGARLLEEIAPQTTLHTLLFPEGRNLPEGLNPEKVHVVSEEILAKAAGLVKTREPVAEVTLPPEADLSACQRLLVLDNVSDPGNVGTLIRTALALGWDGVFLMGETADPFNEKTLRAMRAALFRLPYCWGSVEELEALVETGGHHLYVADTGGQSPREIGVTGPAALVLSSEAHGPRNEITRHGERITVPMPGEMESLNVAVAGAILIFCLSNP